VGLLGRQRPLGIAVKDWSCWELQLFRPKSDELSGHNPDSLWGQRFPLSCPEGVAALQDRRFAGWGIVGIGAIVGLDNLLAWAIVGLDNLDTL